MRATNSAIERGLRFLASAQAQDGSFVTQFSTRKTDFRINEEVVTTFAPALILQALCSVAGAKEIRERTAHWLLKQQDKSGAFNYWPIGAAQRQTRPYPNDLDDTACALAGLYAHNPKLIDSLQLASMVRLLLAAETAVGGPYRTWLVHKSAPVIWQDVDLVVNSNVLHLLQLVAEPLPKLQELVVRAVVEGNLTSPYYPLPLTSMYFLARVRPTGDVARLLIGHILKLQRAGAWATPGQTAWACAALRQLRHKVPQPVAVQFIANQQLPDGSWPAECVWLDQASGQQNVYAGSPALTTAFVLEALTFLQNTPAPKEARRQVDALVPVFEEALAVAKARIVQWQPPLRPGAQAALKALQGGDTGRGREVVLLPQLFISSLANRPMLADDFLTNLSLANIFGWMAYTMYDDFLDDEGEALLLPVANAAMRQSLEYFALARCDDAIFQREVRSMFDRIDAANAWELAHCRFWHDEQSVTVGVLPNYPSTVFLAERSIGHSLTPLAVLAASGFSLHDKRTQLFVKGFRHYLAARQLNDDLHDWQQDVRSGQISYVAARLLREAGITPGRHSKAVLLPRLERQFWQNTLANLCGETLRQLALSRRAFRASELFRPDNTFFQLIGRLEQAMTHTLDKQARAQEFLKHYKKKQPGRLQNNLGANDGA